MSFDFLSPIQSNTPSLSHLSVDELIKQIEDANKSYRLGCPVMSDEDFDQLYMVELAKRVPDHKFFTSVQPMPELASKGRVIHSVPMLSTDKAYTQAEMQKWLDKIIKAGVLLGLVPNEIIIRCTSKYDGMAAKYLSDTKQLVTRGSDGLSGNLINGFLGCGLAIKGDTSKDCLGELIVNTHYFDTYLAKEFSHPRNFISGIATGKKINDAGLKALKDGAIELLTFDEVDCLTTTADIFMSSYVAMEDKKLISDYVLDGVVFEVVNDDIRNLVGNTSHHPLYSIAKKRRSKGKETTVVGHRWQVGHSTRVTPVLNIKEITISGSKITSVTAHNAQALVNDGLGVGAKILVNLAGEIIPTAIKTLEFVEPVLPTHCPACEELLAKESCFLVCHNDECKGVIASRLCFSLKRLGLLNFGNVACEKLAGANVNTVKEVLELSTEQFISCGFGVGQAKVFLKEIARVKVEPIPDSDIISALGIDGLGRGSAKKLLAVCDINNITNMAFGDIVAIHGFAELTANRISYELAKNHDSLEFLVNFFGQINPTLSASAAAAEIAESQSGALSGETVCFTGKMLRGSRSEMESLAMQNSAKISSSITKLTILVTGQKVGETKMAKAEKLGVTIIDEQAFYARIGL
jgi:DNA ligase (NAD+)